MSSSIFVDGICEIDDSTLRAYFQKFGSRISTLRSFRRQSTHACCYAFITFNSPHTANAVLRHRPHRIQNYSVFVKRLHSSSGIFASTERLLPITKLVFRKIRSEDYEKGLILPLFKLHGDLEKFEYDSQQDRLFVEFKDYDSADQLLMDKTYQSRGMELDDQCLSEALKSSPYHGTCRRKAQVTPSGAKAAQAKPGDQKNTHQQYEVQLRTKNEELEICKAQLKTKELEFAALKKENAELRKRTTQLEQEKEKTKIKPPCSMCQEQSATITRLTQEMSYLNDQYESMRVQYQRLLSSTATSSDGADLAPPPTRTRKLGLSTRINIDENKTVSHVINRLSPLVHTAVMNPFDPMMKTNGSEPVPMRPYTPNPRLRYQYVPVANDRT